LDPRRAVIRLQIVLVSSRDRSLAPGRPATNLTTVDVAKVYDEDSSPRAVSSNLEQRDDAGKTGIARKRRSNIGEGHLENSCDHDLARRQRISAADFHVRSLPKANGRGDLASTDAIAKVAKELHSSV
jgi:hypothetical protein